MSKVETTEWTAEPKTHRIVVTDDKGNRAVFWLDLSKGRGNVMNLKVIGRRINRESVAESVSDLLPKL